MTAAVFTSVAGMSRLPKSRAMTPKNPMSRATGNSQVRDLRDLVDGGSELDREDVLVRVSKDTGENSEW